MQRRTPIGYCVKDGKAEIDSKQSALVREIFESYLQGMSTLKIAKLLTERGVLNANQKPSWNHGGVGKILENHKYIGDEFYPPLIEQRIFKQVQQRRKQQASATGKSKQHNSYANQTVWSKLLVCGECGQPYRKYSGKEKTPKWKCKHYIYQNKAFCKNTFLSEKQLETAFVTVINEALQNPKYLKSDFTNSPISQSLTERKLNAQIEQMLLQPVCDTQSIRQLVFQKACEQYKNIKLDDRAYQNEKLTEILNSTPIQTEFNSALLEQTIFKIVVQKHTGLEFHLKNGRTITIPTKEET